MHEAAGAGSAPLESLYKKLREEFFRYGKKNTTRLHCMYIFIKQVKDIHKIKAKRNVIIQLLAPNYRTL